MIQYVFPSTVILPLSLAAASAQVISIDRPGRLSPEQYHQVFKNTSLMQVNMTLDRAEYFPGEDSVLSISVKNPTADTLEIWEPFNRETGFLTIQRKDPKASPPFGDWVDMAPREDGPPGANSPTRFIAPGQEIRQQWLLSGRLTSEPVTQDLMPGDLLTWNAITAYFRLVETSNPIKFIDASADAAENTTITYLDDQGQSYRIKLDPNRNVVP